MRRVNLLAAACSLLLGATVLPVAADDWLAPSEPPARLSLAAGGDADGGRALALGMELSAAGRGRAYLDLERLEWDAGERAEQLGLGLGSDPYADTVLRLEGALHRERGVSELGELRLSLTQYAGAWDLRLRGTAGRLQLPSAGEPTAAAGNRADRGGVGLGLGHLAGPLYLSAGGTRYFYRWETPPTEPGLGLRSLLSPARPLRGVPTVVDWEGLASVSVLLGRWDWDLGYQTSAATDGSRFDAIVAGAGYRLAAGHRVGVSVELPQTDGAAFAQLLLGLRL